MLAALGCAENRDVHVELEAHRPPQYEAHQLEIQAQVTGPQTGLRYKWFSVLGQFEPQASYEPKTSYTFPPDVMRDRVWLEVWRDDKRIAQSGLDVRTTGRRSVGAAKVPSVQVEITSVPRYDPKGGSDTRADIAGTASGELSPDMRVLVYARADSWYIQPTPYAGHQIQPDKSWKTWTHTGSSYAAIIVRQDYRAMTRLDVLPQVDGDVLARTIVEGRREGP